MPPPAAPSGAITMNALAPILRHARTRPHAAALIDGGRSITYRELAALTARTATRLSAVGLARGERVGLCLKDTADHIVALLAAARIGAVAVPLDWRARPAESARLIEAAQISRLLVEPDARPPPGCRCVALDPAWHRAVARAEPAAALAHEWHDPLVISASSGSTGEPKLTAMTHLQYHFAIAGMFEVMGLAGQHRYLNTLPLYYSGGRNSCLAHLLRGDSVILYPSLFGPEEYADVARRQHATAGVVVPSMLRRLLSGSEGGSRIPAGMTLFCTGAPLHAEEKGEALRRLTPNFHERYGAAEILVVTVLRPADIAEHAASVGRPHSFAEIEVVDDDGRPLADGAVGQLRCRGPGLASPLPGSAQASFRGGWFYPGEIASLDRLGYLSLQGRSTDIIMRSGAKVFPAEIEQVLLQHPDIAEAAVFGQPGADGEEDVVAFVVSRREPRIGELLAYCRTRLTPHKVPRQIHFLQHLPKNTAGKIDKRALACIAVERP